MDSGTFAEAWHLPFTSQEFLKRPLVRAGLGRIRDPMSYNEVEARMRKAQRTPQADSLARAGVHPSPATSVDEPAILRPKAHGETSVFRVENLLREARRQRNLPDLAVPEVCMLDPDGDVVRHLAAAGLAHRHDGWACYHSELWVTDRSEGELGIVPCAVGAPYAVLVAEELCASGCNLIVSVTSAGRIKPMGDPPYFILIERAWRDEGTSLHYLPPSAWSHLRPQLLALLEGAFGELVEPVRVGASWTTDAPFRESRSAIAAAERAGTHAVEMEAAALYAYASACQRDVVCIAHVTNTMAVGGDDFEKGSDGGTNRSLSIVDAVARAWRRARH